VIKATIDVSKMELFKEVLQVLKKIVDDERIDSSIREEYMDKLNDLMEKSQS